MPCDNCNQVQLTMRNYNISFIIKLSWHNKIYTKFTILMRYSNIYLVLQYAYHSTGDHLNENIKAEYGYLYLYENYPLFLILINSTEYGEECHRICTTPCGIFNGFL